jgi:Coiled-coil domain-containing protein 124 /Oxs1
MKAAFAAFSDSEMAALKADKPGLKQSQYKELIWKAWQKSPQNPLNQAALAKAQQ